MSGQREPTAMMEPLWNYYKGVAGELGKRGPANLREGCGKDTQAYHSLW